LAILFIEIFAVKAGYKSAKAQPDRRDALLQKIELS
jgi:hypothetical protein